MLFLSTPLAWLVVWMAACGHEPSNGDSPGPAQDAFASARERMVAEQIAARDVRDGAVLAAMRQVPRHLFVAPDLRDQAYEDYPLPIGHEQTISQPYIVALMTELARPKPTDRVLEIGTGCGYQAAVLARIVRHVYTIEIVDDLARAASERLARLGVRNVTVRSGDGYEGWPSEAPFDAVVVTAAPERIPAVLVAQLKPGGRLVIPAGPPNAQKLLVVEKDAAGATRTIDVAAVRFVPMVPKKKL